MSSKILGAWHLTLETFLLHYATDSAAMDFI